MIRPSALAALMLLGAGLTGCAQSRTAVSDARLNDSEVLGVFVSLYQSVLLASQPAVDARDPEIQAYAQRMVDSHSSVLVDAEAGLGGVRPAPSHISRGIDRIAKGNAERVAGLQGAELDSAFVRAQVALHRQTMDWLDFVLIPQASPSLAPRLREARPLAERHLEEIWAIHNLRLMAE